MRRTQVQLDEGMYRVLRATAFERGMSMAALVREMLGERLSATPQPRLRPGDFQFIGSGGSSESGLDPISERHDEALAEDFAR